MADDVLHSGVRGVTDLMVMPGLINLDFADIRTVMSEMGKAMMGTGEAEGDRRAIDAAEAAISNPLLEDVSMKGARGVLINITGGTDMTLFEVDEAANRIREEVDPEANIIFGSTFDEKLAGRMRISVVATGIDAEAAIAAAPALAPSVAAPRPMLAEAALRDTGTGYTQPILTQNAAAPSCRSCRAAPGRAGARPPGPDRATRRAGGAGGVATARPRPRAESDRADDRCGSGAADGAPAAADTAAAAARAGSRAGRPAPADAAGARGAARRQQQGRRSARHPRL